MIEARRQELEHIQRSHAGFREAFANHVGHLTAQFTGDVFELSGLFCFNAIKKDGKVVGKNWSFSAVLAHVVRNGDQVSAVFVSTLNTDAMQRFDGSCKIKVAAT